MIVFDKSTQVQFDDGMACAARLFDTTLIADTPRATFYGFATGTTALATMPHDGSALPVKTVLRRGMYFCCPMPVRLDGCGLLVTRFDYRGVFSVGGPIEETGRLRYIDGCTDSLLIGPPRRGDPCLNHLHFPPNIRQTMHTHPSVRLGVVVRGKGRCVTPDGEFPLAPGNGWALPVNWAHCFYTDDETMDVIAFHPDSDTGPSDDDHPMLNRTIVDGVSAKHIDAIRTK